MFNPERPEAQRQRLPGVFAQGFNPLWAVLLLPYQHRHTRKAPSVGSGFQRNEGSTEQVQVHSTISEGFFGGFVWKFLWSVLIFLWFLWVFHSIFLSKSKPIESWNCWGWERSLRTSSPASHPHIFGIFPGMGTTPPIPELSNPFHEEISPNIPT